MQARRRYLADCASYSAASAAAALSSSSSSSAAAATGGTGGLPMVPEFECGVGIAPSSGINFTPAIFSLARRSHFIDTLMRRGVISRTRFWDECTVRGKCQDIVCEFVPDHSLRSQQAAFHAEQQERERKQQQQNQCSHNVARSDVVVDDDGPSISISSESHLHNRSRSISNSSIKSISNPAGAEGRSINDNVFILSQAFIKSDLTRAWWLGPDVREVVKAQLLLTKKPALTGDDKKNRRSKPSSSWLSSSSTIVPSVVVHPVKALRVTHSELRKMIQDYKLEQRQIRNRIVRDEIRKGAWMASAAAEKQKRHDAADAQAAKRGIIPTPVAALRGTYSRMYRTLRKQERRRKLREEEEEAEAEDEEDLLKRAKGASDDLATEAGNAVEPSAAAGFAKTPKREAAPLMSPWEEARIIRAASQQRRRGLGLKFRYRSEVLLCSTKGSGSSGRSPEDCAARRKFFTDIMAPLPFSKVEYRLRRVLCCPDYGVQIHVTSSYVMKIDAAKKRRRGSNVLGHLGDGRIVITQMPFVSEQHHSWNGSRRNNNGSGMTSSSASSINPAGKILASGTSARGVRGFKNNVALNAFWQGHSNQATVELEMVDPMEGDPRIRVAAMFAVANEIIEVAFPAADSEKSNVKNGNKSPSQESDRDSSKRLKTEDLWAAQASDAVLSHKNEHAPNEAGMVIGFATDDDAADAASTSASSFEDDDDDDEVDEQ